MALKGRQVINCEGCYAPDHLYQNNRRKRIRATKIYLYVHSHPLLDDGLFNIIASLTGHGLTISNDCPSIPKIFDNFEIA